MMNETIAKIDIIENTKLFVNRILFESKITIASANRLFKK